MTVTLATYPHNAHCTCGHCHAGEDRCYWTVSVGGMPVIRETHSQATATAAFERVASELSTHGRKVRRTFWDGYNAQETDLS